MFNKIVFTLILAALTACTAAEVNKAQTYQNDITAACAVAMPLAGVAGPAAPYIVAGCATEEAIAKLALDPSSLEWVNGLIAGVKKA